ncbi:MAG: hypothetical protein F6K31_17765, partial [Symploca sp. SIO2G7]|nr:hypothetical protein [Symploca sp. SIO2G7]
MKNNVFNKLVSFLQKLDQQGMSYTLGHHREEAVMVTVAVPGERWEVEFLSDGSVEVEKFISNGEIVGEELLSELFPKSNEQDK